MSYWELSLAASPPRFATETCSLASDPEELRVYGGDHALRDPTSRADRPGLTADVPGLERTYPPAWRAAGVGRRNPTDQEWRP